MLDQILFAYKKFTTLYTVKRLVSDMIMQNMLLKREFAFVLSLARFVTTTIEDKLSDFLDLHFY